MCQLFHVEYVYLSLLTADTRYIFCPCSQLLALLYTSYGLDEEVENSYRLWIQHTRYCAVTLLDISVNSLMNSTRIRRTLY